MACLCSDDKCPKSSPQNLGTSYLSEKSPSFYKNPQEFFKKHLNQDRVFVCRFAMKPCFVLASNHLVKELLNEHHEGTYNGLQDFFSGLFGPNILFAGGLQSKELRQILIPLMQKDTLNNYKNILEDLTNSQIISEFTTNDPIVPYDIFKKFATVLSLRLFLDLDLNEAEDLALKATAHWHGIISVPLNVKVPFLMSSTYRKALQAREQILEVIKQKLKDEKSEFLQKAFKNSQESESVDEDLFFNTILVFVCALIPKALASIFTSFVDSSPLWLEKYADENGEIQDDNLANIFNEIIRLWPPFFGGLRVANQDLTLGDFHVPEGYGIFYANHLAHRDPQVFGEPEEFKPERWKTDNVNDMDKLFGFGSGAHRCIGENLMRDVMHFVGRKIVRSFTWQLDEPLTRPADREIKCLPVLRPRHLKPIIINRRRT